MPDVNTPGDLPDTTKPSLPVPLARTAEQDAQDGPASWLDDLLAAAVFLTRIPLTRIPFVAARVTPDGLTRALRAFPLAGAAIGLFAGLVYYLGTLFGLPALAAALVAIGLTLILTGAAHDDGPADFADVFGAGRAAA